MAVESPFIKMLKKESADHEKNMLENLPKGIIHGDLKLENIIASKDPGFGYLRFGGHVF